MTSKEELYNLKNIDELDFYDDKDHIMSCHMCGFSMDKLKNEAIKWKSYYEEWIENHDLEIEESQAIIKFIEEFFNLSTQANSTSSSFNKGYEVNQK